MENMMMPIKRVKVLVFITLVFFISCAANAREATHNTLWRVSAGNNTVYLLGSIHLLKSNNALVNAPIMKAFDDSQIIVFEVDLKTMSEPKTQMAILTKAMLPVEDSLDKELSQETYELARTKTAELGKDIRSFHQFKPWFFVMTLAVLKMQELGFSEQEGLDNFFYDRATQSGKNVLGLETFEQQMEMLNIMSTVNPDDLIRQAIKDLEVLEEEMDGILKAWSNGDLNKLEETILKSFKEFPDLYNVLITRRNKDWINRIDIFLRQKENHMVVVGAAHLAGKEGLVELLKKKGYSVEQL